MKKSSYAIRLKIAKHLCSLIAKNETDQYWRLRIKKYKRIKNKKVKNENIKNTPTVNKTCTFFYKQSPQKFPIKQLLNSLVGPINDHDYTKKDNHDENLER